jgi:hypothetical protein
VNCADFVPKFYYDAVSWGRREREGLTKRFLTDMSTIKFDEFREK